MRARDIVRDGAAVRLRPLAREDLQSTLAWRNAPESLRWFKTAQPLQWESHLAWYENYRAGTGDDCMYFVETLAGEGVGQSSIYNVDAAMRQAEVGRFLSDPAVRGRGLFREALLLTLEVAFREMALDKVYLEVRQDNERAIRLYESVGFHRSGAADPGLVRMEMDREAFTMVSGVE